MYLLIESIHRPLALARGLFESYLMDMLDVSIKTLYTDKGSFKRVEFIDERTKLGGRLRGFTKPIDDCPDEFDDAKNIAYGKAKTSGHRLLVLSEK